MDELDSTSLCSSVLAALTGELGAGIPKSLSNHSLFKYAPVQPFFSDIFSWSEKSSLPETM